MSEDKKQDKVVELDKIYQEYSRSLQDLRKQQDQVISNFIEALKQESINELRKKFEKSND